MILNLSFCTGLLGIFLAAPLVAMRRARPANLWLGLFIGAFSSLALADGIGNKQLFGLFDWPLPAMGPCFYMYVRSLTGKPIGRREALHFLPTLAWSLALAGGRILMPGDAFVHWLVHEGWPVFGAILLSVQVQSFVYAVVVLLSVWRFHAQVKQHYSSMRGRDLRWLGCLCACLLVLLVAWIPATMASRFWTDVLIFGRLLLMFGLGWYGLHQPAIFRLPNEVMPEKYARSGMDQGSRELIGKRLAQRAAQARDHLESEIKLADLAERIGTSPQLLSQYLNEVLEVNFFEYINNLRVGEVQAMLRDPAQAGRPLLELAMAAGFNSKSTFNAAFKKQTGMAPSAWRAATQEQASVPIG